MLDDFGNANRLTAGVAPCLLVAGRFFRLRLITGAVLCALVAGRVAASPRPSQSESLSTRRRARPLTIVACVGCWRARFPGTGNGLAPNCNLQTRGCVQSCRFHDYDYDEATGRLVAVLCCNVLFVDTSVCGYFCVWLRLVVGAFPRLTCIYESPLGGESSPGDGKTIRPPSASSSMATASASVSATTWERYRGNKIAQHTRAVRRAVMVSKA